MDLLIFVICGSFQEYNAFLLLTGFKEKHARYVSGIHHIKGFSPHPRFQVVYYGSYWDNPIFGDEDFEDVASYLSMLTVMSPDITKTAPI